ncbi:MAG: glycosyltransferase family 4 protein [Muribaculaceae bacterium]|nr:glycosyltransferase family 4 protein [Muribaculaceae bacterium]
MENNILINNSLSSRILTIGCKYNPPRGGIAQVLWNYDNYVFEKFNFIENSRKSNAFINVFIALGAVFKLIYKLLFDKKIKIVHIHSASKISFKRSTIFIRISKLFKKRVVIHIHGGGFEKYYNANESFVRKNLKHCDKIITLSQDWVNFYSSIGFESTCVENVIPVPQIQEKTTNDGVLHMLYLGLIIERKGIYDFLDVLSDHKQEFAGKLMLHIGGNGEVELLDKKIKSQGLGDIVKYEGWVDSEKKVSLLNLCDVFVLPSYVEGLPLSILEAMSYNMAIISTPVGGIPSLVKDQENGFLFEPGDKAAMYKTIKLFLEDKDTLDDKRKDNNQVAIRYYPENVAKKLKSIYSSLLDNEFDS